MQYPSAIPAIIGLASNVRGGSNPPFGISEFHEMYPQFFKTDKNEWEYLNENGESNKPDKTDEPNSSHAESGDIAVDTVNITTRLNPASTTQTPVITLSMLEAYIELAHSCVKQSRFRTAWKVCMGLFIAHFVTLYMETMVDPLGDAATVAKAGQAGGLMSSKSVDGVSVSYDYSQVMNDLDGWANWKATAYGAQLATWAKMFSMGGMYIR